MKKISISEISYTIQGEGLHSQLPMVFIRFAGCNLLTHCDWCDTWYAWDIKSGTEFSVDEIYQKVLDLYPYRQGWVCITGGEPLFQPEGLLELVRKLKSEGTLVTIETNGATPPPYWYTIIDSWSADIKCPSSGVCGVSSDKWFDTRVKDQIKFVVGNEEDLKFARAMIRQYAVKSPKVIVSPVSLQLPIPYDGWDQESKKLYTGNINFDQEWLQRVWEFCLEMRVRFSLQSHKVVWGNRRGV